MKPSTAPDMSDLDDLPVVRERKLRDMRPMEVALAGEAMLLKRRMDLDRWLETVSVAESGTPLTRYADIVASVARYAMRGRGRGRGHAARLHAAEILSDLLSCPTAGPLSIEALERVDPYLSDLVTVCCAALGRYRIEEEKEPIPDAWLAAMASVTTTTIRSYLSESRTWMVPLKRPRGDRWRVTVASATQFLAHRAAQEAR